MTTRTDKSPTTPGRRRRICTTAATLALLVLPAVCCTGCDDELGQEFRSAALGQIETGVGAIMDGLIDGLFTIATPDSTTDTTGST